ncbi:hypothetical protein ACGFNP_02880 [Nonomuraea sp. NPDC049269]|uniref:hypothetical protein n=1 Tax=Nonomuraea sp. NPDC049269 TaxID=3364349 RepID=UPI0037152EFE
MSEETHASCSGNGACFPSKTRATFYCTCPESHDYVPPKSAEKPKVPVKLVREGNIAWGTSGELRQEWLKQRLASRTDPGQVVLRAVTRLLAVEMPEPLSDLFGAIHRKQFYKDLVGAPKVEQVTSASTARLGWMLLARVAAAIEYWLTQNSWSNYLWRSDCLRAETRPSRSGS